MLKRLKRVKAGFRLRSAAEMTKRASQGRLEKLEQAAERAKELEEEAARLNRILNYA